MTSIQRDIAAAENEDFDVIVIGGGIYGAMLLLESVRAGLKALLIEERDFASQTSFRNLRIVHGGLRYLQTLHLSRFRESVAERRWFLRTFPELVSPLRCLMPLYGGLMRHPALLRSALLTNDWLSRDRNRGLAADAVLPPSRVLTAEATRREIPLLRREGLRGAALWYDAVMPHCHRIVMESLRWAAAGGGRALNYVAAVDVGTPAGGRIEVAARASPEGSEHKFRARRVVNAAGPRCRTFAAGAGADVPRLFHPSLAWNLLLDRPPLTIGALALQPPRAGARVYFAHSLDGRLLAGTGHAPCGTAEDLRLRTADIAAMLDDLNAAAPGLDLELRDVIAVLDGQLPVKRPGTVELADKAVIVDHGAAGGCEGFWSVSGVKFTTARSTAARAIREILRTDRHASPAAATGLPARPATGDYRLRSPDGSDRAQRMGILRRLIRDEAPQTLADLLLRRADLAFDAETALGMADRACDAFGWDADRAAAERDKLQAEIDELRAPLPCRSDARPGFAREQALL